MSDWEDFDLDIMTEDGPKTLVAIRHPGAPGLAITNGRFNLFDVTHVGTGTRIGPGGWERCASAMLELAQLSTLIDWTQDSDSIMAQREKLEDEGARVPFPGCTSNGEPALVRDYFRCIGAPPSEFPWEEKSPRTEAEEILDRSGDHEHE